MIIETENAHRHMCPYNEFKPCLGPRCMAWSHVGRPLEYTETDNLVDTPEGPRPTGELKLPEGEGWQPDGERRVKGYHQSKKLGLPPAVAQRWVRTVPVTKGRCARINEHEYYPF